MKHLKNYQILGLIFIALFVVSCSTEEQPTVSQSELLESKTEVIPSSEIDQIILKSLRESGDFIWGNQSDELVWSALIQSDSVLTIGYQASEKELSNARIGLESVESPEMQEAAGKIIGMITEVSSKTTSPNLRAKIESEIHTDLPYLEIRVSSLEALRNLRNMSEVRYFEPRGYEFDYSLLNDNQYARITSDSGCENEPQTISGSDFSIVAPGAKASWNYDQMGISQAWTQSTGAGITVGVIDTGLSPDQPSLNGLFNSGQSSGRTVQKFGTYKTGYLWWKKYDGPNDLCGHGTAMAGVVASPRNTVGNAVGVAYNSNLISVRGTSDVIFNSGNEKDGVTEALVLLGKRSDVKIISMSIGDLFSNSKVADAIRYANNRGKLIFAAAGTSTTFTNWVGVIFPATMSETVAVTGVKEGSGYQRCDTCHSGSQVEFTVIMERAGSNTKPLTTALYSNDPSTVGGSSVATATASGIAALVWAKNPSWTKDQVLNKMKSTADLYPSKSSEYGYGNLNAASAVN
ncbi:Serine protease, subtilisin family [Algoriphagus locisalis]|uniref:Serine protease, subtilisin family n=1 Tax=Algoriphagus locisalis TaxID=305507 RepID=A0A1I6YFR0_9BACT|nr:S8 family serine peptidase [Algoriphagus locisalis]SFT49366.1 Serine protease, subtilisin family [Algoriphagus locisalis]